jgi:hypothetical protein
LTWIELILELNCKQTKGIADWVVPALIEMVCQEAFNFLRSAVPVQPIRGVQFRALCIISLVSLVQVKQVSFVIVG